jgi:hypothetical protein
MQRDDGAEIVTIPEDLRSSLGLTTSTVSIQDLGRVVWSNVFPTREARSAWSLFFVGRCAWAALQVMTGLSLGSDQADTLFYADVSIPLGGGCQLACLAHDTGLLDRSLRDLGESFHPELLLVDLFRKHSDRVGVDIFHWILTTAEVR